MRFPWATFMRLGLGMLRLPPAAILGGDAARDRGGLSAAQAQGALGARACSSH